MEDRSHFLCSFGGLGSTEDMQPVFFLGLWIGNDDGGDRQKVVWLQLSPPGKPKNMASGARRVYQTCRR